MEYDNPVVWVISFIIWFIVTIAIWKGATAAPLKMRIMFTIAMALISFFIVAFYAGKD